MPCFEDFGIFSTDEFDYSQDGSVDPDSLSTSINSDIEPLPGLASILEELPRLPLDFKPPSEKKMCPPLTEANQNRIVEAGGLTSLLMLFRSLEDEAV
ncbi:hypothetical protein ACFX13_033061 [Malus domestica]